MFEYMTVKEAAKQWDISERQVQKLCKAKRIAGVIYVSRVWLIPKGTHKPADARRKENKKSSL